MILDATSLRGRIYEYTPLQSLEHIPVGNTRSHAASREEAGVLHQYTGGEKPRQKAAKSPTHGVRILNKTSQRASRKCQ